MDILLKIYLSDEEFYTTFVTGRNKKNSKSSGKCICISVIPAVILRSSKAFLTDRI